MQEKDNGVKTSKKTKSTNKGKAVKQKKIVKPRESESSWDFIGALTKTLDLRPVVSFKEFVTSPDFCGSKDMYEYWFKEYSKLPKDLGELLLDGSLGTGKTTFCNYYMAYRVYCLLAGGSPQTTLGLAEDTEIYVFYFSVSLQVAKRSGFMQLYNIMESCKWFEDNAPINDNLKSSIHIPSRHFHIDYASTSTHAIGLNVWGFILDEANFRSGGVGSGTAEQYAEVTELYTQLLDRIISRNAKADGTYDGLAILISSASYQSSFVEQRKMKIKGIPYAKCITSVAYEVKPFRYSKERFEVFIGNGSVDAQIIKSEEQKQRLLSMAGVLNPDDFIRSVPTSLKSQFEQNIVLALQNHCGVPTMIEGAFMSNIKPLVESYDDTIPPIFTSEKLTASTEDDTQLVEYLIPLNIQYPQRPHSIYLDLSVQHDTGSLVCYRYDGKVGEDDMHTRVFSLKIIPPPYPAQTKIQKVKTLVVDLAQHINIVAFASDQYQCFAGDSLIPTKDGVRFVRDLKEGDFVYAEGGLKPILATHRYFAQTYKVNLSNGAYFQCTGEHRFVCDDGSLVPAEQSKGKVLSINTRLPIQGDKVGWVDASSETFRLGETFLSLSQGDYEDTVNRLLREEINFPEFFGGVVSFGIEGMSSEDESGNFVEGEVIYCNERVNLLIHLSRRWGERLGFCLSLTGGELVPEAVNTPLKVVSVEEANACDVYDISIGGNEIYSTCMVETHNSTQLRQDVTDELGLENIRLSLDSTDVPFMHWAHALAEKRIRLTPDKQLEKEVQECVHDYKRHRVVKNKKSSDDVLQGEVGAFFLSDTIGKTAGLTVEGLSKTQNLVGGKSYNQVLNYLGYNNKKAKR